MFSVNRMVKWYKIPIIGGVAKKINNLLGVDIPRSVIFGENVSFPHNSVGTVIHDNTQIGNNVKIYQNVTLGRADVYMNSNDTKFKGFIIEDGVCICAGAKVICKEGFLKIGQNSVIAANAVLLNSTGKNEIWAGVPAKLIGYRKDINL